MIDLNFNECDSNVWKIDKVNEGWFFLYIKDWYCIEIKLLLVFYFV